MRKENPAMLLDNGVEILNGLIADLERIIDNKNGLIWNSNNRQLVTAAMAKLKLLDQKWNNAELTQLELADLHESRQAVRLKIARVQQLISTYMMLLEGSKSLVKGEIGRINKAKLIRGYRFRRSYQQSAGQLC